MANFTEWTLEDADGKIADAKKLVGDEEAFEANEKFVDDQDHWQSGDRWVGPEGTTETRDAVLAKVERQFTPRDAIGEVLGRIANALLKTEPDVTFTPRDLEDGKEPTEQQQKEIAEMVAHVSAWWDRVKLWERARTTVKRSRWAERGALRLWIAPGHLEASQSDEGTEVLRLPTGLKFDEALERLQLMAPSPGSAMVYTDPDSQQTIGIYLYEVEVEGKQKERRAELWYVDGEKTVLRVVREAKEGEDPKEEQYSLDIGGRIPIAEMQAELLITEPVRKQQDRLNFFESILNRVGEAAGFPERYTTNAEPHGIWLQTTPSEGPALDTTTDDRGRTWYLHAAPRTLGAAVTTDLRGIIIDEEKGQRATPGVVFKEPTDPEYAIKASRHAYQTILESCKQAHILISGDATASGVSRVEARADYEDDLTNTKTPLEGLLRDVIECVIAWAGMMSGGEYRTFLERYRCVVNLHVNSGPILPAEHEQINTDVEKGMLSQETGMALKGVEDVAAEIERMRAQPESQLGLREKQMAIITPLVAEGATWEAAAKIALIEDKDLLAVFRQLDAAKAERDAREAAEDEEIDRALQDDDDEKRPAA